MPSAHATSARHSTVPSCHGTGAACRSRAAARSRRSRAPTRTSRSRRPCSSRRRRRAGSCRPRRRARPPSRGSAGASGARPAAGPACRSSPAAPCRRPPWRIAVLSWSSVRVVPSAQRYLSQAFLRKHPPRRRVAPALVTLPLALNDVLGPPEGEAAGPRRRDHQPQPARALRRPRRRGAAGGQGHRRCWASTATASARPPRRPPRPASGPRSSPSCASPSAWSPRSSRGARSSARTSASRT